MTTTPKTKIDVDLLTFLYFRHLTATWSSAVLNCHDHSLNDVRGQMWLSFESHKYFVLFQNQWVKINKAIFKIHVRISIFRIMPGFSVKILTEKLSDSKFLCEWCGSLLRGAKKASCGHFFCSSCVDNLLW